MKKEYLTPLAEVVKMQAEVMICVSGGDYGEGDIIDGGDIGGWGGGRG